MASRGACDRERRRARGQAIPGMGALAATASLAAAPEAAHCTHGRPWAARRGLAPRAHATGGTPRRLGVRTRGEGCRRQLLGRGARAARRWAGLRKAPGSQGGRALTARRGNTRAAGA